MRQNCITLMGTGNGNGVDVFLAESYAGLSQTMSARSQAKGDSAVRESACHPLPASLLKVLVQADTGSDVFLESGGFALGCQLILQLLT